MPHARIAGLGVEPLGPEIGQPTTELFTDEARTEWAQRLQEDTGVDPATLDRMLDLAGLANRAVDPERPTETVNFLVQGGQGTVACGISMSGRAGIVSPPVAASPR